MEERNEMIYEGTENTEVAENYDSYDEVTEGSGKGGLGIALVVGVLGTAAGVATAWKKRDKIKEWYQERQITKAEKKLQKYDCQVVRASEDDLEKIEEVLNDTIDVDETE